MRHVRGLFVLLVVFAGCAELAGPEAERVAFDGFDLHLSQGGNSGLYFLQPLHSSSYSGTFAPDRSPLVHVCAGEPASPCDDPVAHFDMVRDAGESMSRVLRMSARDEHYMVNWTTNGIPEDRYRIFVIEAGAALGFIDVVVARGGRRMRVYEDLSSRPFSGTIPIKFRLEEVDGGEEPPPPPQEGLRAQYFDWRSSEPDFALATPILERVDATVDFLDATGSTDVFGLGQTDHIMARWTGSVHPVDGGLYTFCVVSDDGVRLWINDALFVDNWVEQDDTQRCSSAWLAAGTPVGIRMEWYHTSGGAAARLYWQSLTLEREIIPSAVLRPE